ncbi:protein phosphatase 1 regulatory subunit 3E [Denticeps clupeoides]|uniref:protein phosphatase 1 regulatory subunit 3E n=1 Tax=Denticeps clupeoides TaxID=299321 RepID=UPI0010A33A8E|nr:protein phosphatase 1 regulatory subunit 3E-like [Denticeps clupeoides]
METDPADSVVVMLPPKNCIPRNYSCIAGLFGGLAAMNQAKDDGDEDAGDSCETRDDPVVDERPRGRDILPKPLQSPTSRRRCKSLPTPTERARLEIARSRSPSSQKKVRFADSLGLELISVRHFDDGDVPEVPRRVLDKFKRESPLRLSRFDRFPGAPATSIFMEMQFTNPGTLPGFVGRVKEAKVMLECVETDDFSLSGTVRVLNVAFEKKVLLRYTLNNWITFMDTSASYLPNSSDGVTDRFSFKIITPTFLETGGTLQFAVRYCVDGEEFWDNNNGNNYKVRRHRFKISPPREWEDGWIHFI